MQHKNTPSDGVLQCDGEPNDDDPLNINILELEGMHAMEVIVISSDQFPSPLKIKKVNIGSPKNTNLANIGD